MRAAADGSEALDVQREHLRKVRKVEARGGALSSFRNEGEKGGVTFGHKKICKISSPGEKLSFYLCPAADWPLSSLETEGPGNTN